VSTSTERERCHPHRGWGGNASVASIAQSQAALPGKGFICWWFGGGGIYRPWAAHSHPIQWRWRWRWLSQPYLRLALLAAAALRASRPPPAQSPVSEQLAACRLNEGVVVLTQPSAAASDRQEVYPLSHVQPRLSSPSPAPDQHRIPASPHHSHCQCHNHPQCSSLVIPPGHRLRRFHRGSPRRFPEPEREVEQRGDRRSCNRAAAVAKVMAAGAPVAAGAAPVLADEDDVAADGAGSQD
jgi:hypothetical protein